MRLAAVFTAASLFIATASAQAATLVSNLGQPTLGATTLPSFDAAQGFTTGSNEHGYTLTSVEVSFNTAPSGSVTVKLATGLPSATTTVATLTNPPTVSTGTNTFTAPPNTVLSAGTTYFVVIEGTGDISNTSSTAEDSGGASGWDLADRGLYRTASSTGTWTTDAVVRKISINGVINSTAPSRPMLSPPRAPDAPKVRAGVTEGSLQVSWTAPPGLVSDYDLRYYAGSSNPMDETDWVEADEAGGHDYDGTATSSTITGLQPDTVYLVQVRAANRAGSGPWSASGSATALRAPAMSMTAPSVSGNILILTFDQPLSSEVAHQPPASEFSVTVAASAVALTMGTPIVINANTVTLTLAEAVRAGEEVAVSYTGNTLQGTNGVLVAPFSNQTVTNHTPDKLTDAWLARFGRTVTDQVVDAVTARLSASHTAGTEMALAGQALAWRTDSPGTSIHTATEGFGFHDDGARPGLSTLSTLSSPTGSPRDLLAASSFVLTAEPGEGHGLAALWGRTAITGFDGREDGLDLDGEVMSAFVGADWASGTGPFTAGFALGRSRGTGRYRQDSSPSGKLYSTLTGLYPYAGMTFNDHLSGWVTAGYGEGRMKLDTEDRPDLRTDLTLMMGAAGIRSELLRPEDGLRLAMKGDARFTQTESDEVNTAAGHLPRTRAETWQVRGALEGEHPFVLNEHGSVLTPTLEIGLRLDGGEAETGFGAYLATGLAFTDPRNGLQLDLKARALVTHERGGFDEWSASAALAWDPHPASDRGLSLTLAQVWGISPSGGLDALLTRQTLVGPVNDTPASLQAASRLEGELGYGLAAFGGGFTAIPNLGFGLSDTAHDWRVGWRLRAVADSGSPELSLDATRREPARSHQSVEHRVLLHATLRW
ncbi:MAG: SwmB domain-containing protein [Gammaproteobacteria bacterium]|nr:SwmB domain-containing protein [Gammaproteobacteria bacterium]